MDFLRSSSVYQLLNVRSIETSAAPFETRVKRCVFWRRRHDGLFKRTTFSPCDDCPCKLSPNVPNLLRTVQMQTGTNKVYALHEKYLHSWLRFAFSPVVNIRQCGHLRVKVLRKHRCSPALKRNTGEHSETQTSLGNRTPSMLRVALQFKLVCGTRKA